MSGGFRVRRRDLAEVTALLPDPQPYAPPSPSPKGDLYICALGFEPRCLAVPERCAEEGGQFGTCLYLQYTTNAADNQINLPRLTTALTSLSANVRSLEADDLQFVERLREAIRVIEAGKMEDPPAVTLDMSVVANRVLFRCMRVLLDAKVRLRLLYAEAATYYPTQAQFSSNPEKWTSDEHLGLEQGVGDIRVSRNFPGQQLDLLPDCVVLFPSFKAERSNAVLAKVDPALLAAPEKNVIWLLGVPHHEEDHWRLDAMRRVNRIDPAAVSHEVSTFFYKETLQRLHTIYEERCAKFNITLSPLGSKMQALGAALFCQMRPDVRVVFSIPRHYNASQYSDGCKAIWEIDFGYVPDLRQKLNEIGTLMMEKVS